MARRQRGPTPKMEPLIEGAGLSMRATQTIMTHAANLPPEKRDAILRRLHGILNKYMNLADKTLDEALRNPGLAGRSFLSSMGNNILQILVSYTTLDEVKQQQVQASLSVEDREQLHSALQKLNEDKRALSEVRESLMKELAEIKKRGDKEAEPAHILDIPCEEVASGDQTDP